MTAQLVPACTYVLIFATLLALTFTTVEVARLDLGLFNVVAAITIAVSKALLVAMFFMHLLYTSHRTKFMVAGGILWLIILIPLTLGDVLTRGWLPVPRPW